ncbi:MAG: TIGR04086 family membrane protein [Veillonellaceae bacterium]|jgi:putative membrane protein (TIGR04086 family)|nr:TIGR04086 family membrane protein [Veillonellaceae bacterium]
MTKITRRARLTPKRQPENTGVVILIFKGVFASLLVSIACVMFLSIISLVTENTLIDKYMQYIMVGVTMISIFVGSVYATQKAESKGLIIGMAIGIIYVLCSIGIGLELSHEPIVFWGLVNKCIAGLAAGALGGLVGVNL